MLPEELSTPINRKYFLAKASNIETILWLTYGWRFLNWLDMFARAARQLVCRYLS